MEYSFGSSIYECFFFVTATWYVLHQYAYFIITEEEYIQRIIIYKKNREWGFVLLGCLNWDAHSTKQQQQHMLCDVTRCYMRRAN